MKEAAHSMLSNLIVHIYVGREDKYVYVQN